jgi:ABC-type transporter Mla MlaB component
MSAFQATRLQQEDRPVLLLEGYLNQRGGETLRMQVQEILQACPAALALDFSGTTLVNSIGVSFLLEIIEAARRGNTSLEFVHVPADIGDLFSLLGILSKVKLRD